jgi:hypothetical protein
VPISANNKFVAWTEPFIELNDPDFQRGGLSIRRNFAGASIPLSKGIEVLPGYLNQTIWGVGCGYYPRPGHFIGANPAKRFCVFR